MLIGGLAVGVWAEPRATRDADLPPAPDPSSDPHAEVPQVAQSAVAMTTSVTASSSTHTVASPRSPSGP
jgi:hypothetical protein